MKRFSVLKPDSELQSSDEILQALGGHSLSLLFDRYWDSNAFRPQKAPGRFLPCDAIIKAAERGECRIVTSTLTWSEVFWMKTVEGSGRTDLHDRRTIR